MKFGAMGPFLLAVLVGFSGCARFTGGESAPAADPEGRMAEAAKLVQEMKFTAAIDVYRKIQQEHPNSAWSARAKFSLAMVCVSSDNPQRDYAQAFKEFDEFLVNYPADEKAGDARTWRQALKVLLDAKKDNERLKANIEQLKQLDMRQEEKRTRRK